MTRTKCNFKQGDYIKGINTRNAWRMLLIKHVGTKNAHVEYQEKQSHKTFVQTTISIEVLNDNYRLATNEEINAYVSNMGKQTKVHIDDDNGYRTMCGRKSYTPHAFHTIKAQDVVHYDESQMCKICMRKLRRA
jgi:hypothetical protein